MCSFLFLALCGVAFDIVSSCFSPCPELLGIMCGATRHEVRIGSVQHAERVLVE